MRMRIADIDGMRAYLKSSSNLIRDIGGDPTVGDRFRCIGPGEMVTVVDEYDDGRMLVRSSGNYLISIGRDADGEVYCECARDNHRNRRIVRERLGIAMA